MNTERKAERPPANPVYLLKTETGRNDRWYCADWGSEFEAQIGNYPPPPAPHRMETRSGRIFVLGPDGRMVPERSLSTAIADWFKRVAGWFKRVAGWGAS